MAKKVAEKSAKRVKQTKQTITSTKKQQSKRIGRERRAASDEGGSNGDDSSQDDSDSNSSDEDGRNADDQDADKSDGDDQGVDDASAQLEHLVALTKGNSCARCFRMGMDCLLPAPQPGHVAPINTERQSCQACAAIPTRPSCGWPSLLRDSASYSEMKRGIADLAEMIEELSDDDDSPHMIRMKKEMKACVEAEQRFDEYTASIRLRWGLNSAKEVPDLKEVLKREGVL